jgi:signal transduction histidine kinase
MMPKMSGDELLTALRARPEVSDIPAIVLTARNEETLSAKLLRGGAQDYVMKPFAPEELCARIDNLLAARQAAALLRRELSSQSKDLVELAKELVAHKRELEAAHARAEASSRTKDEFLSLISHELRTPLTPLLLGLDLLRDQNMEKELWDDTLDRLEQCARTEQKLVEDLLDVSKSLSGKLRIELEPVILRSAIEAALESAAPSATAKGIRITARIAPDIGTVLGDSARLQQIVWNLLSNSVKFTPAHGRVDVHAERRGGSIRITVTDTGIGIAPTFLPHVFDRFRQADSSTARPYGGLGVGLAIVRELAELHGGRVHAASDGPGTGATFTVELPLASAIQADPSRAKGFAMRQPTQPLSGLRILIAEDDRDTLDTLTYLLIYRGAEVKTATTSPEALSLVQRWLPDVLVSDIGLPGQDGYELIRMVRALAPEHGAAVPAVALTAYAREEDQQRALSSGFQGHIAKPFDPSHLVATLRAVADRTSPWGARRITDKCA